jgi:predicted AAA+ superfamily ATPase
MPLYERKLVNELLLRMNEERRFIQIVVGPRQSGKTTALSQAVGRFAGRTHFVSADDPMIVSGGWLKNEWAKARMMIPEVGGDVVLIVDEIQKVRDWSSVVKQCWDEDTRGKRRLKVVLSGSSALLLQKGMSESLMGRFEVLYSPHWAFVECTEAFGYTLDEFLFFGGYPGAAPLRKDEQRWSRYIGTSIVEPTIAQDVLMMEEIRKPALLKALFTLGANYSAQELSYTKMLGQLQDVGNTVTLAHYLELLAKARMLCGLPKYSDNRLTVRKSSPRLMVYNTALMSYTQGQMRKSLIDDAEKRGHLVESAVGAYLLGRADTDDFEVFWWNERIHEVDFVIQKGSALTAIEVKSGRVRRTGGCMAFKERYPDALCYIIGANDITLEDFLRGRIPLF